MMLRRVLFVLMVAAIPFSCTALSLTYERPLTLTVIPEHPAPGESVHLTIQSYSIDLNRSDITWSVNDKIIAQGAGIKDITVRAGALGTRTSIVVIATENDENVGQAAAIIAPTEVILLWDSDSYVPPFYKGRSLAGTSATLHAYALARLSTASGVPIPERDIIYTWSRGGTVLNSLSGRGKSSISLQGPALYGSDTLGVQAESSDRSVQGVASARIPATDTALELYENHPLFGILFHRAFAGDVNTNENEEKVTAVPYFAHVVSPSDSSLTYEWHVNDSPIAPNSDEPQTLTITAQNYTGPARISLSLTNANDILMRATNLSRLIFGGASNVFGSGNLFGQ